MTDSTVLLADLQEQVRALETDLAAQLGTHPDVESSLREEHRAQRFGRRTGAEWPEWRDAQLTQIAVAWVLGTVFLRWTEDHDLIEPVLSGPGDRIDTARELQQEHYRRRPYDTDADWLRAQFEVLRASDAGRLLFDPRHNPLYLLPISHDAARALIAFWQDPIAASALRRNLGNFHWDTRFLGDLYEDLSEDAKKRYALLQTPSFVESFILDRTLTPAIDEFGLDTLRLIDPACGSGHFLLGAFKRLVQQLSHATDLDRWERAKVALDAVHGVDINPFAVSITRFRLTVAAWHAAGITSLAKGANQEWRPVVGCGDSLLPLERQHSFDSLDEQIGRAAPWEDLHEFSDHRLLVPASYHVVVGNPPYITVKDPIQNEEYRGTWTACHRQYQLTVPFAQRFFDLAVRGDEFGTRTGRIGQITSNAFMTREFGTKLVENFLPSVTLDYVVDTSGAYIPGHGTPTMILVGRRASPNPRHPVRTVRGILGEAVQPEYPEKGKVWLAIADQTESPGSESEWVSVADVPQLSFSSHPWNLSGGGASELLSLLDRSPSTLREKLDDSGSVATTRADEAYFVPRRDNSVRTGSTRSLVQGSDIRDWCYNPEVNVIFPYDSNNEPSLSLASYYYLWPFRTILRTRVGLFQGQLDRGLTWFEFSEFSSRRLEADAQITYAEVATHNHFISAPELAVEKNSAPILTLSTVDRGHVTPMLNLLNSSLMCFWLRQKTFPKGGSGNGGGFKPEKWMERHAFNVSTVVEAPLPLFELVFDRIGKRSVATPLTLDDRYFIREQCVPTAASMQSHRERWSESVGRAISEQEEMDWEVYDLYGLLNDFERGSVTLNDRLEDAPELVLGERAFEIVLARRVAAGASETRWFGIHGSSPTTELPDRWPDWYREVVEARIALIEKRRDIALIERPECKRRWATEPWEKQQERALQTWLLDRLEAQSLWYRHDDSGLEQPQPQTVRTLADQLQGDEEFESVARLWASDALAGREVELVDIVAALVDEEHVPFLATYRYKGKGLEKRTEWERIWDLQRQEDAVAVEMGYDDPTLDSTVRRKVAQCVGDVPVPPKYTGADFVRGSYWTHRGKLDVPKERFVSYPDAARPGDGSLLLGWAGWDHRERAHALAVLIGTRRSEDGWDTGAVTPLVAGLAEAMPWVHQWHAGIDEAYGQSPAEIYQGFLEVQLGELGLTSDSLHAWRPSGRVDVSPLPRRKRALTAGSSARASRPRSKPAPAPDGEHADAVLQAAVTGPLANEDIRAVTGLDTAGARRLAVALVEDGRLITSGQRRGMRYHLASPIE